ncbi:MAG: ABC-2 transporter permease [Tissierellia bacterium]|nr:ABC-2 transporter permease [Tissierellia bacterium]
MKGLILKDIYNLRRSLNTFIIFILAYSIFSYATGNIAMLMVMSVFLMSSMAISSIVYDDLAKWDIYALTMPVTRRQMVLSKYILQLLLSLISALTAGFCALLVTSLRGDLIGLSTILDISLDAYIAFLASLVYLSVNLPLIYKFGVEHARLLMFGTLFIPIGIIYILDKMGVNLPSLEDLKGLLYLSPLLLGLVLILSISISYRIYRGKEM